MAKRLSSVLGIDIGSRSIKIAEVKNGGKEAVVTAIGMIATPEGAVDHTGVYNPDAVGAALKQVISESGVSSPAAVVSIAGQASVLVRTLEVPRMNSTELKEHMQWEINRNIPFAESTVVSDFKPLEDGDPNSPNMDVVMAIAPQSAVDTLISCLKKAGKTTHAIDVEPLGLARSLTTSYDDLYGGQTVCVVDVGHKTTSINIYKDGKLLMPRQVPVGGENFTRAIADALGVGLEEAEALKSSKADVGALASGTGGGGGFGGGNPFADAGGGGTQEFTPYNPFSDEPMPSSPGPMAASEPEPMADEAQAPVPMDTTPAPAGDGESQRLNSAMGNELDEFVAEIRRSIDYFRNRGGDVNRICLCGGGAQLRGLPDFLGKSLGIACDAYDPLRRLNLSAKKADASFVDSHRSEFAVAVGNGLHILFD